MLQVGKLVGISSQQQWSQVHSFWPSEEDKSGGALLLAVSVAGAENQNLAAFGGEIILRLHEQYYGVKTGGVLERLQEAVEKVKAEFGTVELTVAAGVMREEQGKWAITAVTGGKGQVRLVRAGAVEMIVGEERSKASGWLNSGDVVVVGTDELFELVTPEEMKGVEGLSEGEVVERWAPELVKGRAIEEGLTAAAAGLVVVIPPELADKTEMPAMVEEERQPVEEVRAEAKPKWWEKYWKREPKWGGGKIYVRGGQREVKWNFKLVAALVLAGLLVMSIGLGWRKRALNRAETEFAVVKDGVERQVGEVKNIVALNPQRARVMVAEASKAVADYENLGVLGKKERAWVEAIKVSLADLEQAAKRSFGVTPTPFLDLNLTREGSHGEVMDLNQEQIVVLDRQHQVMLKVGLSKTSGVVGGGELLAGAKWVSVSGDRGFVWGDKGIVEVNLEKKTAAVVVASDEQWQEIADIKAFGGNLYVLDKGASSIWRYGGTETGFGAGKRWLGEGVRPDLSQAVSMAIDGSIWVLTSTGKLVRYTQGQPSRLEITGLDGEFNQPAAVYTDADSANVYVLDKGNRRIVVLNKDGQYQGQYEWEGMGGVTDMVVSEKQKQVLLLSGSMIETIELR